MGAQGVLDPEGEPLFLPPLDQQFGTGDGAEEIEGVDEAQPEVDADDEPADEPVEDEPVEDASE